MNKFDEIIRSRRSALIEALNAEYFHPSGYCRTYKHLPVHSQADILEKSGQILFALNKTNHENFIIEKIVKGYINNSRQKRMRTIVPRTVFHGETPPPEKNKNIWEADPHQGEPIDTWYRTDVSHSQFFYMMMGLASLKGKPINNMMKWLLACLQNSEWNLVNLEGKTIPYGRMKPPVGNAGLRLLYHLEMYEHLTGHKPLYVGIFSKLLLKLNFKFMTRRLWRYKPSDTYNTAFALRALRELNEDKYGPIIDKMKVPNELPLIKLILGQHVSFTTLNEIQNILINLPFSKGESVYKVWDWWEVAHEGEGNFCNADLIVLSTLYLNQIELYGG